MSRIKDALHSSAVIVAVLALVAAVGGTAVAGNDATSSALTKKKVKALIKKEVAAQIGNATGPPGTPGASGADGAAGADGANGTARAYALVEPHAATPCTGGVSGNECTFTHSKGITRVYRDGVGRYCVAAPGIDPPVPPAVTVDRELTFGDEGNASALIQFDVGSSDCDDQVHEYMVTTERLSVTGGTDSVEADDVSFTIVIP